MIFKLLRKYIKVFLWATAIIVIPSFILWGVGSGIRGRSRAQTAGRLFDRRVSLDDFEVSLRTVQMLLYLSDTKAYAQFLNPIDLAWDRLILLHEAERRKISVPNEAVVANIQNIPEFRVVEGTGEEAITRFDTRRYEDFLLRSFRISPRTFEEEIRKTLMISKLREAVVSEVSLDEETLQEEYKKRNDKRKISYLIWKIEDFEKEVTLQEKDIAETYERHKIQFRRPEERRVAYVTAEFEETSKEKVLDLMDRVLEALLEGQAMESVASLYGLDLRETGFFTLGDPPPGPGFSPPLMQEAFLLEVGALSDPVETENRITLLKVLEARPSRNLSLEEVREAVERVARREKAGALCEQKAKEALQNLQKKMTEEALSWEEAAKSLGFSLNESPFFTREGLVGGIGYAPQLTRAAFALELKEIGEVVQTPEGFAIFRVKEELPSGEEAFLKEKEAFQETLLRQKQAEYYFEWYRTLRANARLVSYLEEPQGNSL